MRCLKFLKKNRFWRPKQSQRIVVLCFFWGFCGSFSYSIASEAPILPQSASSGLENKALKGIHLAKRNSQFSSRSPSQGILIDPSLGRSSQRLLNALKPFLNQRLDRKLEDQVKSAVYDFFKKNGRPFIVLHSAKHSADFPFLNLIVSESSLASVVIEGNRWSKDSQIKKWLNLSEGQPIDEQRLLQAIRFIGKNPSRSALAIYSPGPSHLTTNVKVQMAENLPVQFYCTTENTGVKYLKKGRSVASFSWTNAFNLGDVLSYRFSCSNDLKTFRSHSLDYTSYFRNLTWLELSAHAAATEGDAIGLPYKLHGMSAQASACYNFPCFSSESFLWDGSFGLDYKLMNQVLEWGALSENNQESFASVFDVALRSHFQWKFKNQAIYALLEFIGSPGRVFPFQSDANYASLRTGSTALFAYFRLNGDWDMEIGKLGRAHISLKAQSSFCRLLPSEQIGIGGANSVRGYRERELNRDHGLILSTELQSNPFCLSRTLAHYITGIVFIDSGWGVSYLDAGSSSDSQFLCGAGPGIRYQIGKWTKVKIDWGWKLNRSATFGMQKQMLSYSVTGSF